MLQTPSRKLNSGSISDNTKRILAGISKSVLPTPPVPVSLPGKLAFQEAVISGRFTPDKFGLYKEADKGTELGKIWVKKHIKEADGTEGDWLVVYTNDEDEIIRQLASAGLKDSLLQKTAADAKQPNPKDIPIAPGIKSKNITMDQSGASGTAKVTVEFTDTDQALKFYQDQGEPAQQKAPVAEEKPAGQAEGEGEQGGEKPPANIQAGNVPPVPPTPQASPQAGPRMTNLKSTIQNMSRFGQQVVYVIKKEAYTFVEKGDKVENKTTGEKGTVTSLTGPNQDEGAKIKLDSGETKEIQFRDDGKSEGWKKASITYSFINEHNEEISLPWRNDLRIGSMFERPDTGQAVRLAGYTEQKLSPVSTLIDELIVLANKPYFCEDCEAGFSEGQMNFHKNHTYKKKDGEDKEEKEDESAETKEDEKKEASQKTAADISDEVPPMGWDSSKGAGAPANAGPAQPPQQNLQDQKPKDNVLYDSNQDSGPQFQTTINPKDKSVSIKFIDSVAQDALQAAVNKPAPALTQPQQAPAPPPAQPQGQGQPGGQPGQTFNQVESPVTF